MIDVTQRLLPYGSRSAEPRAARRAIDADLEVQVLRGGSPTACAGKGSSAG